MSGKPLSLISVLEAYAKWLGELKTAFIVPSIKQIERELRGGQ